MLDRVPKTRSLKSCFFREIKFHNFFRVWTFINVHFYILYTFIEFLIKKSCKIVDYTIYPAKIRKFIIKKMRPYNFFSQNSLFFTFLRVFYKYLILIKYL